MEVADIIPIVRRAPVRHSHFEDIHLQCHMLVLVGLGFRPKILLLDRYSSLFYLYHHLAVITDCCSCGAIWISIFRSFLYNLLVWLGRCSEMLCESSSVSSRSAKPRVKLPVLNTSTQCVYSAIRFTWYTCLPLEILTRASRSLWDCRRNVDCDENRVRVGVQNVL